MAIHNSPQKALRNIERYVDSGLRNNTIDYETYRSGMDACYMWTRMLELIDQQINILEVQILVCETDPSCDKETLDNLRSNLTASMVRRAKAEEEMKTACGMT